MTSRKMIVRSLGFALALGAGGVAFGKNQTYYWIGADGATFHDKANWALADGSAASAYPQSGDAVVFTNATALSLAASKETTVDTYRFEGAGAVTLGKKSYTLGNASGAGGIFATGSGTYKLDYTVTAPNTLGEYPIEVAEGALVYLSSYGTTWINDGATLVKRGPGDFTCGKNLNWFGALHLEGGKTWPGESSITTGAATTLKVSGTDAKRLYVKGESIEDLHLAHYVETEDAAATLTIEGVRSAGANLTLAGTSEEETRFSADFYNSVGSVVFNLIWDPQTNATLALVKRTYDHSGSSLVVTSGRARLTEGAGVTSLKEIRIATNATFEIAAEAGAIGTGAPMVVDEGGTLVVGKTYLPGSKLTWNGTVRLEAGIFPARNSDVTSNPTPGATADLVFAGTASKTYYVFSNNSFTLRDYAETPEAEGTGNFYVWTSSGPTLTLKGTKDTRFSSVVENGTSSGTYTLRWQPVGNQTLSVVKRVYSNAHTFFTAGAGRLRVAEGAAFKVTGGVSIESGATLVIATDVGGDWSGTPLALAADASVAFEGDVAVRVKALTVGGTALAEGIYSKANATWITGDGAVLVGAGLPPEPETVAAAWTGGGASGAIGDAANWGGMAPNLTDGSLVATFPDGASLTLPDDGSVWLKGFVAEGALQMSGGAMRLGSAGIVTAGDGKAVTVDAPIKVYAAQTWAIGANDLLTFTARGVIGSAWPACIGRASKLTWTGANDKSVIELKASSPDLWNIDAYVQVEARADNALGGAGATFTATNGGTDERAVRLYGNTFANDFVDAVEANGTRMTLFNVMAGSNTILGKVTGTWSNALYWHFDNSSQGKASVTFRGGYAYAGNNNNSAFSPIHNGTVTFADVPFNVTRIYLGYRNYYSNTLNLNVASNRTTRGVILLHESVLNTTVPDALYATDEGSSGVVMNPDTRWNLSADQSVNVLSVAGSPTIASETGATLTLRDDRLNDVKQNEELLDESFRVSLRTAVVQTNAAVFAGNVNFVKAGGLDLYLNGASTTTGDLTVTGGRLIFRSGSWRAAGKVTLAGGRVRFENKAIGRETEVVVAGEETTGAIEIPAGVTVRCKSLTVNGKAASDGLLTTGVVTGGGTLSIGEVGFAVILR